MTKKIKAVLDTNVYLSAIIFGGVPRKILDLARDCLIEVFISPSILLEIAQKLNEKFFWEKRKIETAIRLISTITTIIKPKLELKIVKEDPADDKILECASEAKAAYIITGDRHLLKLRSFKEIKILSPSEFLKLFLSSFTT